MTVEQLRRVDWDVSEASQLPSLMPEQFELVYEKFLDFIYTYDTFLELDDKVTTKHLPDFAQAAAILRVHFRTVKPEQYDSSKCRRRYFNPQTYTITAHVQGNDHCDDPDRPAQN